jgi:uncharacterized protein (TIGR02757 family)
MGGRPPRPAEGLGSALERLYASYDRIDAATDPIQAVRPYGRAADQEVAGFIAAALAFGRVASVMQSVGRVLAVLGPAPAAFVRTFDPVRDGGALSGLVHRWTRGSDLVALLLVLRRILEQSGSIEAFFAEGDDPSAPDVAPGLESFSRRALAVDVSAAYGRLPARPGVCYFFPRASSGSACKRLNLFLRWMVRRDGVDLGIWRSPAPARLIVPLDVHLVRMGRCLGLTRYRSPGWRMAQEITASLRRIDPVDPVRFDFALCHLGMRGECGFSRPGGDSACPLRDFCRRGGARTRRRSQRPSGPR